METLALTFHLDAPLQELLIAELADLGFGVFEQEDESLTAYIEVNLWTDAAAAAVQAWLRRRGVGQVPGVRSYAQQDWNAAWEASIVPLSVGPFLIKPTWADLPQGHEGQILLVIDPKMSFGTGYHESTRLVLRSLPDLVKPGCRVLDAGTGTGILSIAAIKLGAAQAIAFDSDAWVAENVAENLTLNGVAGRVVFNVGLLDDVAQERFDLILANINKNILLGYLEGFAERLASGGHLVLAGLLVEDREEMLAATRAVGLVQVQESSEGAWWSVVLQQRDLA